LAVLKKLAYRMNMIRSSFLKVAAPLEKSGYGDYKMKVTPTPLKGAFESILDVYEDEQGYFFESFNREKFKEATGIDINFVQDNESFSKYGVIRGLHYQKGPYAQAKLVRVIEGEILDVMVDINKDSPTYGKHFSTILSGENKKQAFIPKGFAHGFAVTGKFARVVYKCDEFYNKQSEGGILYNDPILSIEWTICEKDRVLSEKDLVLKSINHLE
jgi:dTDP-4-dehydrorhamnose 3,5-epimerase